MTEIRSLLEYAIGEECSERGAVVIYLDKVHPRGVRFSALIDWGLFTFDAALLGYQFTVLVEPPQRVRGWLRNRFDRHAPEGHATVRELKFAWGEPRPFIRMSPAEYQTVQKIPGVTFSGPVLLERKPVFNVNVADPQSFIDAVNKKKSTEN